MWINGEAGQGEELFHYRETFPFWCVYSIIHLALLVLPLKWSRGAILKLKMKKSYLFFERSQLQNYYLSFSRWLSQNKCTNTRNAVLGKSLSPATSSLRVPYLHPPCFAYFHVEVCSHWWAVDPPGPIAVLQQEDPERGRGPAKSALSSFSLQLGRVLSVDLSRALQTAGFMAVLSLRYRHQGRSLVVEDDWSCFTWCNLGANSSFVSPRITEQSCVLATKEFLLRLVFCVYLTMSINSGG